MSHLFKHFQAERINTIEPNTSTYYLNSSDSGSIVFCDPSNNYGSNLYLPMLPTNDINKTNKGLNFTIILKNVGTNHFILNSINEGSTIPVKLMYGEGEPQANDDDGFKTLTIEAVDQKKGDRINCISDGKYWYVTWIAHGAVTPG